MPASAAAGSATLNRRIKSRARCAAGPGSTSLLRVAVVKNSPTLCTESTQRPQATARATTWRARSCFEGERSSTK